MSKRQEQFLARLLTFLALALGSAANANGSTFTYDTVNGVTTKYLVEDDVNPTGYPAGGAGLIQNVSALVLASGTWFSQSQQIPKQQSGALAPN
jgi:hypothetical protein